MIDNRNIVCIDFETSSSNTDNAQILQIGACVINQSLEIIDEFESLIKPENEDTIEQKSMEVNRLNIEDLRNAPDIKNIFPIFANWLKKYNIRKSGDTFGTPIFAGWGIDNFDYPIFSRYCKRFDYWNKKWNNQSLMNPIFTFDVMKFFWWLTRQNNDVDNVKLETILEYAGLTKEEIKNGAHNAVWDVKQTARLATKILNLGIYLNEFIPDKKKKRVEIKDCLK